jgi:hypothetical protein
MEKAFCQSRVTGELIPEEIKTTSPKRGLNLDIQWQGEEKKLLRRPMVQAVVDEELALELAGAPETEKRNIVRCHYNKYKKAGHEALEKAERIKKAYSLTTGYYSRLKYLLAIRNLRRNKKFLLFLDWHDAHLLGGKEQEILDQQWVCVQGKKKFPLIFHRMKKKSYSMLQRETGVKPRLARRYVQLAVEIGIWQKLGNFPQRGWGIVYTSGYFAKFKDPKTKREGYKKIRWLKESEKEMINALQDFHVRY